MSAKSALSIGGYLKRLREQRGLSVYAAAKKSNGGISHTYILQLENDKREPTLKPSVIKLNEFAKIYEVPIDELVAVVLKLENKQDVVPPYVLSNEEKKVIDELRAMKFDRREAFIKIIIGE